MSSARCSSPLPLSRLSLTALPREFLLVSWRSSRPVMQQSTMDKHLNRGPILKRISVNQSTTCIGTLCQPGVTLFSRSLCLCRRRTPASCLSSLAALFGTHACPKASSTSAEAFESQVVILSVALEQMISDHTMWTRPMFSRYFAASNLCCQRRTRSHCAATKLRRVCVLSLCGFSLQSSQPSSLPVACSDAHQHSKTLGTPLNIQCGFPHLPAGVMNDRHHPKAASPASPLPSLDIRRGSRLAFVT